MKCLFENAFPEPDFRYFLKAKAKNSCVDFAIGIAFFLNIITLYFAANAASIALW